MGWELDYGISLREVSGKSGNRIVTGGAKLELLVYWGGCSYQ